MQSITSTIKELEEEEFLLQERRTQDGYHVEPEKKDYMVRVEHLLSTHETLELALAQARVDLNSLYDSRDQQKLILLEVDELLGGPKLAGSRRSSMLCPMLTPMITQLQTQLPPKVETADKASQADTVAETQSYVESIERRHYTYMLEAFKSLRFTVDLFSPVEIKHPKMSKRTDDGSRTSHADEQIRLRGTLSEVNTSLSRVLLNLPKPTAPLPMHRKGLRSTAGRMSITKQSFLFPMEALVLPPELELAMHVRLDTLDPFVVTQTNAFPRARSIQMTLLYDELEETHWKVPEIADIRFNIKDIVPLGLTQDELHLRKYFRTKQQPELDSAAQYQQACAHLGVLRFLRKYRLQLRSIFVSYNTEGMQTLPELLTMSFSSFIGLLKDALLMTRDFDVLDAAKVFYLAFISSKKLPESALSDEKSWLRALVMGSAFKEHYQLRLSNFFEALVRLVMLHPRYVRLVSVPPHDRLTLLYKRDLKPNVRKTQAHFYATYLEDPFIIRAIYSHENELFSLYDGYITRLSDVEKVTDFAERHGKLELGKFYSLLSNSGILLDAEIQTRSLDDADAELLHIAGEDVKKTKIISPSPPKASTIRFPSTLIEKAENKNLKIIAPRNLRSVGATLSISLPFYRPLRAKFLIDKLTVFNFFVAVMKVGYIQSNDELFLMEPRTATDQKFVIGFSEFCEAIGLLGLHFWKTTSTCEDLSMSEGLSYFIKIMVERHRFYRELRGLTSNRLMTESKEMLLLYTQEVLESTLPLITKTVFAQERFVQRRLSN